MVKITYANNKNEMTNPAGDTITTHFDGKSFTGFNPKHLLEASLALCSCSVLTSVLQRDGKLDDAGELQVDINSSKDETGKNRLGSFVITIHFPDGLDDDYKKKVLKIVEKGCSIGNTLREASTVTLEDAAANA